MADSSILSYEALAEHYERIKDNLDEETNAQILEALESLHPNEVETVAAEEGTQVINETEKANKIATNSNESVAIFNYENNDGAYRFVYENGEYVLYYDDGSECYKYEVDKEKYLNIEQWYVENYIENLDELYIKEVIWTAMNLI